MISYNSNIRTLIVKLCLTAVAFACVSCRTHKDGFTPEELALINGTDSILRVLTIDDAEDYAVLRTPSADLPAEALLSADYERLAQLMVATVTDPSQDGVGIAGPQVGLNRRIVAVQRFDKGIKGPDGSETYPFEVYPNIRIVWASDSLCTGEEGCLSVPGQRGQVTRSKEIIIEYTSLNSTGTSDGIRKGSLRQKAGLPVVRDTVRGFTAIIFQHETDHLDGILYIDKLKTGKEEQKSE